MRWVQQAAIRPHRCAVVPYLGNSNSRGFIDTGQDMYGHDNHIYVSVEAVEHMARMIGWQPPAVAAAAQGAVDKAKSAIANLEETVEALEEQLSAVHTLTNAGFKTPRKTPKVAA